MTYGVGHGQDSEAEGECYTGEADSEQRALVKMLRGREYNAATATESQDEGPEKLRAQTVGHARQDSLFADESSDIGLKPMRSGVSF